MEFTSFENGVVICGDCFDFLKTIQDIKFDAIITDIPYEISVDNNFKTMKDRVGRNGIDFGEWDKTFNISKLKNFSDILSENGSIVLFHSFEQYSDVKKTLEDSGLVCKDKLIWEKTNPMPRNRDRRYISNCEMASWYVVKKAKWTFNRQDEKYQKMIFRYPSESGGGFIRYHPTQKNLDLMCDLIKIHTNECDLVFDPFSGSGTTAIACINTNRKFICIEKEKKYYDISVERIKNHLKDK